MPHQLPPDGDWKSWVIMGGRGAGKTRAGSEWVRAQVEGATPLGPGRARRKGLGAEGVQRRDGAAHHHAVGGVADRRMAPLRLGQGEGPRGRQAAQAGEAVAGTGRRIHRLGAGGGEVQHRFGCEQAGAAEGREIADAVAHHHDAGGLSPPHQGPGGEASHAAQDLPDPVGVQVLP